MSEKKSQRANSSHNIKCEDLVTQINNLVKKIKIGNATVAELNLCKKLTKYLKNFISKFSDIDEFDKWVAQETIEMSEYTCARYDRSAISDKI
jgi:hypothetical protein